EGGEEAVAGVFGEVGEGAKLLAGGDDRVLGERADVGQQDGGGHGEREAETQSRARPSTVMSSRWSAPPRCSSRALSRAASWTRTGSEEVSRRRARRGEASKGLRRWLGWSAKPSEQRKRRMPEPRGRVWVTKSIQVFSWRPPPREARVPRISPA